MARHTLCLIIVAGTIWLSCENSVGDNCTLILLPGITVELVDASTELAPKSQEFVGVATDGEFTDSVVAFRPFFAFAYGRPGVYNLRIRGDGYKVWTTEDVSVTRGECHVNTVALVARLEPAAAP